jgi:antitoxin component HigA of HigAB toxin-antitoxin module
MKTLISKELYEKYTKECDELQEQICEYENDNDIPKELRAKYRKLSSILIDYEKAYHPLPGRVSTLITDEIKTQMEKNHLKQRSLAKMLGMQESRVSDLLNGKRPLNLNVVKKLHSELHIPADFLLAHS